MAKLPVYNEEIFQYADTVIDVIIQGAAINPAAAKYVIYPQVKATLASLGQSKPPVPNLVELSLNSGIVQTDTGLQITIPRTAARNLIGRFQHELSVVNQSGALDFIFTGELSVKQTNGRYA